MLELELLEILHSLEVRVLSWEGEVLDVQPYSKYLHIVHKIQHCCQEERRTQHFLGRLQPANLTEYLEEQGEGVI